MTLQTPAYVILGMLDLGAKTGYDIRRSAELSLRFFWALSPRQIYAELRNLEAAGLIEGTDDPRGSLRRRTFELTPDGRAALLAWLRDEELGFFEWRDKGLLKLFFADALDPAARLALVRRLRERAIDMRARFDTDVLPVARRTRRRRDREMPEATARFGREFWEFMADWCERFERELDDREIDNQSLQD